MPMKFSPGQLVTTPGVIALLGVGDECGGLLVPFIRRHVQGDWGEMDAEDKTANNAALKNGDRLFSAYKVLGETIWIITEAVDVEAGADPAVRVTTTVLLPDEY